MEGEPTVRSTRYVYFIQMGPNGPIKIGSAVNVKRRLSVLQVGNPEPLRVIATLFGNVGFEKRLHRQFQIDKIREEWFRPSSTILNYIQNIKYNDDS